MQTVVSLVPVSMATKGPLVAGQRSVVQKCRTLTFLCGKVPDGCAAERGRRGLDLADDG